MPTNNVKSYLIVKKECVMMMMMMASSIPQFWQTQFSSPSSQKIDTQSIFISFFNQHVYKILKKNDSKMF